MVRSFEKKRVDKRKVPTFEIGEARSEVVGEKGMREQG